MLIIYDEHVKSMSFPYLHVLVGDVTVAKRILTPCKAEMTQDISEYIISLKTMTQGVCALL